MARYTLQDLKDIFSRIIAAHDELDEEKSVFFAENDLSAALRSRWYCAVFVFRDGRKIEIARYGARAIVQTMCKLEREGFAGFEASYAVFVPAEKNERIPTPYIINTTAAHKIVAWFKDEKRALDYAEYLATIGEHAKVAFMPESYVAVSDRIRKLVRS